MFKNNIIVFPTPKKPSSQGENKKSKTDSRVQKDSKNRFSAIDSLPAGKVIPLKNVKTSSLQLKDNSILKVKKPSHNPYKDWYKNQNKAPNNLIDGKEHWPTLPHPKNIPSTSKEKPYVFAGTSLSFLLVAMALLVGQGNNKNEREIATAEYYQPPIRIIKNNEVKHNVMLYRNEYGKLTVSLTSSEGDRYPASVSSQISAQNKETEELNHVLDSNQESKKDTPSVDKLKNRKKEDTSPLSVKNNHQLHHPRNRKKVARNPNTLTVKQVWRNQEQRALYLIKTGQRKIINIGQPPH